LNPIAKHQILNIIYIVVSQRTLDDIQAQAFRRSAPKAHGTMDSNR